MKNQDTDLNSLSTFLCDKLNFDKNITDRFIFLTIVEVFLFIIFSMGLSANTSGFTDTSYVAGEIAKGT